MPFLVSLDSNFQVSKVNWASPLVLSAAKEEAVAKFLWWIITSIVNVILKSFFYITELDHQPRTKVSGGGSVAFNHW